MDEMWEMLEQIAGLLAGGDEGSSGTAAGGGEEVQMGPVGQEGLWLLGLCIFDFAIGGLAAALCLLSSLTSASAPSPATPAPSSPPPLAAAAEPNELNATAATAQTTSSPATSGQGGGGGGGGAATLQRRTSSYIHPLQIVEDFRDRWRTRWRHQQYFEVVTYHNGDQYEVKNFRPVKNVFAQQRSGRMEHEISVSDYKRHCEMAKKIVGYESLNDFKVKNPSVVYRNYFRLRGTSDDAAPNKAAKAKKAHHKYSSPETSPRGSVVGLPQDRGPKRCALSCSLCGRHFDYVARYLTIPSPSSHNTNITNNSAACADHSPVSTDATSHHIKSS